MFNNYLSKHIIHFCYFNPLYNYGDNSIQKRYFLLLLKQIFVLKKYGRIINKRYSSIKVGYGKMKFCGGSEWKYEFKEAEKWYKNSVKKVYSCIFLNRWQH